MTDALIGFIAGIGFSMISLMVGAITFTIWSNGTKRRNKKNSD